MDSHNPETPKNDAAGCDCGKNDCGCGHNRCLCGRQGCRCCKTIGGILLLLLGGAIGYFAGRCSGRMCPMPEKAAMSAPAAAPEAPKAPEAHGK